MNNRLTLPVTLLLWFLSAIKVADAQSPQTLFKLLPSSKTGITFSNTLYENDTLNILNQANIYNGGGVGVGDFNNDGLADLYFAGNMVPNRLYLNKGAMKFEDQTNAAGVAGDGHWCTGVTVVDINGDGWLDIYVSASFSQDVRVRTNLLYVNQGLNNKGIPQFKEEAKSYGLADTGFSTQGYFFDYDRDGDLDLYLVTNALYDPKTPIRFRPKVTDGSALNTDRLYRNNGNNTFTDVSGAAGILWEGWGHAACISDFNRDGFPDIYVANDFVSNDLLYINNGDGTFTNHLADYFKHTSWNAMGTEVADLNNDGWPDLVSLEMLPETNLRKKTMLSGNEYYNYFNSSKFGYQHQYVRNVLQLNSGATPLGHPVFSDIGFMAGIYQTDWSWCPMLADFDNDGFRDMIITNGLPRDVTDLDYVAYDNGQGGGKANLSLAMTKALPVVHIPNYAFKNINGLQFRNVSANWGLTASSFSNGGVYTDLDNDGDLDIVVNNINAEAYIYENTLRNGAQKNQSHYIAIQLEGSPLNKAGIGSAVRVYYGGTHMLYDELQPTRGYLSTVSNRLHFGMGSATKVDSIIVQWSDGNKQSIQPVKVDTVITIRYQPITTPPALSPAALPIFTKATETYGLQYLPVERDFIDYTIQPTLPHKLSQYGPGIAVGDIDQNGFDDVYLGGTSGHPGVFFLQDNQGNFKLDSTRIIRLPDELQEEMGVLFFDADGDGDLDLYAVSGSYEIPPQHPVAQDRLFINDGKGNFTLATDALPTETTNGSCVKAADFDGDGDLDLFVGGRVVSGAYPTAPQSFILRNDGGKFTDVTTQLCPPLSHIGMVTDALWTDFDNDGKVDLVVTGEWMPITFLKNKGESFSILTNTGVQSHKGWWNSLVAGDFDNDGDMDYIAGNLGLNSNYTASTKQPMTILAKDLDKNGSLDAMVFCYMKATDGTMQPFPMHAKEDLSSQLVSIRKKYPTYKSYGRATMNELWPATDKQGAIQLSVNDLQTSYMENMGNGTFAIRPMPLSAQRAPIYGMVSEDINGDGNLDLVMVGNDYSMEPYSGRHDALNGVVWKGDGKGNFTDETVAQSGFFVKGDGKGLATMVTARSEELWLATQNADSLLAFTTTTNLSHLTKWIDLKWDDQSAAITYANGTKRKTEFYYGSTYLSQSSRKFKLEDNMVKVIITNFKGQKRELR